MRNVIFASLLLLSLSSQLFAETTVAAILPLTGNAADQGEWARRGFTIASEQLKQNRKGDFSFLYEDSKGGDPATAVQAYKAVLAKHKVPVVFTFGSGVGMALSPLVNADHVIQMGIATATPKYTSEDDYTFRNFPSAALESDFLADMLVTKLGAHEIAILHINSDYGVGTAGAAEGAFTKRGGVISFKDSYNPGETDFRSLLLKLRSRPNLIVYLASYPTDGALILKQAREMGLSNKFIASVAIIGGKDFFSIAADASEGLLVVSTAGDANSEFEKRYTEQYTGESPAQEIYAARAYDALLLVAAAVDSCKSEDTDCIRKQLSSVKNYPGASGTLTFNSAGDVTTSFSLFEIHEQAFKRVP